MRFVDACSILLRVALTAAASASMAADGEYIPLTDPYRLNTLTEGDQDGTDSCTVDNTYDGTFVTVWQSSGQAGEQDVIAQRRQIDGTPVGTEFVVNTYTTGRQYSPALAVHYDSSFVVVWASERDATSGLFAQRFDSADQPLGTEFAVTTDTGGRFEPSVDSVPGGFVVVWQARDAVSASYDIVGRRFDGDGTPVGTEFTVNSQTASSQQHASVSAYGNFVVVWESDAGDGDGSDIFGQRFDEQGAKNGTEFQVSSTTSGVQRYPDVALTYSDNFIVVWQSAANAQGDGARIFAQSYEPGGVPYGSEFPLDAAATGRQLRPAIDWNPYEDFVVTWKQEYAVPDSGAIVAQWLFFYGGKYRDWSIANYSSGAAGGPGVTAQDESLVFVWTSTSETPATGHDIFAQGFALVGLTTFSLGTSLTTVTTMTTTTTLPAAERCSQPVTAGAGPTSSDCLFILRAALSLETCAAECACAPGGALPITASDALACLRVATGVPGASLDCPC